jgi:hypothetical protein
MSDYQPPEELVSLAAQLADGELTEAEHDVLRGHIAADPRHAAWFVEWMELNAMLQLDLGHMNHIGLTPRPLLPTEVPEIRNSDAGPQANVANNQTNTVQPRHRATRNHLPGSHAWLTIAGGLLLAVTFLLGFTAARLTGLSFEKLGLVATDGDAANLEIATIAGGVDAEFGDGVSLGSRLRPGTLRLNKGIAQVVFDRGAVVVLQGPAELELVDAGACRLVSGSLAADVVPDANGFSVGAGDIQIYERDARFGLRTGPQMATEVHALGGGLDLVGFRGADGLKRRLAEGEAIRWQGGTAATGISLDPNAFVTSQELARRQQLSEQRSYNRWLAYSKRWLHDPSVVLRYEFSPSADGVCVNTVDPAAHAAKSRQSSPRWITGRWSSKMSMLFDGRTDVLEVADDANLRLKKDFSLAVWMRVRSYSKKGWTRIVGKGNGTDRNYGLWMDSRGTLLWQVCPDTDPDNQKTWDRYSLETGVVPIDEWQCVVGVVEGTLFKIYINGVLQTEGETPADIATSDDPLTIGFYDEFPYHDEYFCGELDELILLDRALTESEIREMFDAGEPRFNSPAEAADDGPSEVATSPPTV